MEKYLPLGTVVLLKGGKRDVMIIGYRVAEKGKEEFDYMGVLFPEGKLSGIHDAAFNHDQIEKVIFKGLDNEKYQDFNKKLLGK